jgi:PAS domain S-box-containing protein
MLEVKRSWLWRYGIAGLTFGLALLLKQPVSLFLGNQAPFVLFFGAILVSAWYSNLGTGLLTTVLATLTIDYFYLSPNHSFLGHSLDQNVHLSLFALEGISISWLSAALGTAKQQAETSKQAVKVHQDALHQTKERHRLLVECVKDYAIFMLDPQGCVSSWNVGAEHLFGYEADAIVGQHFSVFYTPEDQNSQFPAYELEMAAQKGFFEDTGQRLRQDGTYFWADVVITALHNENNELSGFSKVTRDVTERKWVEEELRRAVSRSRQYATQLRGLTEAALAMNSALSLSETLRVITQQARSIIGAHQSITNLAINNSGQAINTISLSDKYADWRDLHDSPDSSSVYALICRMQHSMRMTQPELEAHPAWRQLVKVGGKHLPMRGWLAAPLTGRDGHNMGVIQLSDKYEGDFTESDEAIVVQLAQMASVALENARLYRTAQEAQEQLRHQLQFTSAITNSLGEGVYALDQAGCVTFLNPAAEQMLGWTAAELLNQNIHQTIHFQRADGSSIAAENCQLLTVLDSGKTVRNNDDVFTRKDGTIFPVAYTSSPIVADGQVVGAVVAFHDISDRKQAEEELARLFKCEQAARAEAEAANRTKDEFLATLSHELRTPLNAMLGWARLLRTRKFSESTTARALETIERNARLQTQLVEDILDVSRIIQGKLHLYVRPVELIPVIEAAVEAVRLAAEAKAIQLESVLDPAVGLVLGDPDRLQQVVWNLLSNAIKFTPKGGRVEVQLQQMDSQAQVQVSDTGIGIHHDFLPYVFDRFRQADSTSTRPHGGLGLGLAIVRHLVELHGGTVQATSSGEGQGAIFRVNLPLMAVRLQEGLEWSLPKLNAVPLDVPLTLKGIRVLVVDDEADARDLLITVLEQYGAEVEAVASAEAAIASIIQFKPDLLVSDIGMPGEDGYALMRRVKILAVEQAHEIPAIALTAYAREDDRRRALLAGFQRHMSKPIEPLELIKAVASLVRQTEAN